MAASGGGRGKLPPRRFRLSVLSFVEERVLPLSTMLCVLLVREGYGKWRLLVCGVKKPLMAKTRRKLEPMEMHATSARSLTPFSWRCMQPLPGVSRAFFVVVSVPLQLDIEANNNICIY